MAHRGRVAGVVTALLLMLFAAQALGEEGNAAIRKLPQDIQFSGLAGGVQIAVLFGDPNKPGMYVMRVRYPKGFKAKPHFHSDGSRTIVVLSGTLYYALGEQWDERKLEALPAGTFFTEPANAPHFVWAKDDDVVIQLTSIGPSRLTPIQPPNRSGGAVGESGSSE